MSFTVELNGVIFYFLSEQFDEIGEGNLIDCITVEDLISKNR